MRAALARLLMWESLMRQYHLGINPGDVARRVMLVGDPERATRVASHLSYTKEWRNREFVTITGLLDDEELTVVGTGIGADNTEIAIIELTECQPSMTLIRVGSCGALQPNIQLGDLVVSTGAVRLENTSSYFVPDGFPAVAHHDVINALEEACLELNMPHHVGITATASGFYGAQGRKLSRFPSRSENLADDLARYNVLNMEMEASALMTLSSISGHKCGVICAVYGNRPQQTTLIEDPKRKSDAEKNVIITALRAFSKL
jgi:uridine phosphorylase